MAEMETKPDWSCGGYVYEDVLAPKFGAVERNGVLYPYVEEPDPDTVNAIALENAPFATIRWLRPEECPTHKVPPS